LKFEGSPSIPDLKNVSPNQDLSFEQQKALLQFSKELLFGECSLENNESG
jgi:hypothetical protein